MTAKLHVNIDHIATLRNARGSAYPSLSEAAKICEGAGAAGITIHLREDRRHIRDEDAFLLRNTVNTVLNFEMATTDEMIAVAQKLKPDLITLVPEKRLERTTEGGLDVPANRQKIASAIKALAPTPVHLFIDPEPAQVEAAHMVGAAGVELHTGDYAHADTAAKEGELARLKCAADALPASMTLAAGHGLTLSNVGALMQAVVAISELNIGHALICDAVFKGLAKTVQAYREAINAN